MSAELKEGMQAPDFSAAAANGETISLRDLRGKNVVLYFYPKDDTPGCTVEACAFRDAESEMRRLGAAVLGVSRDGAASHKRFTEKYQLNFPLLADEDETICRAYGVIVEKTMYGKKVMGIERSTFLIGGDGVIRRVWRKVKAEGHAQEVLAALQSV